MANPRYLYFAKVAVIEGYPEIAGNFRETAEGQTSHAHGHLDYLKAVDDPAPPQDYLVKQNILYPTKTLRIASWFLIIQKNTSATVIECRTESQRSSVR